ncbi:MAG: hypothetical protein ACRDTD_12860 [Pseudonocardiaceae bacterium]
MRAWEIAAVQLEASVRVANAWACWTYSWAKESWRLLTSPTCYRIVDERHGFGGSPSVGLVGHFTQDVGAERSVISAVGSAQGRDVVALREPVLAGVEADPPHKLSEFGERAMELAASGVTVRSLIE